MTKDKRFLVFTFDIYYPGGGMDDLKASFDTLEEAKENLQNHLFNYGGYNIYDRVEGITIEGIDASGN